MRRAIRSAAGVMLATLLLGVFGFSGCGAGCKEGQVRDDGLPLEADRPKPALRLLVLTDLQGRLEPCGCTSRPLGGIDKLAARVRTIQKDDVPTLLVAAGDTFFDAGHHADGKGADAGAKAPERWRAQTMADVLGELDLAAATVGPLDVEQGAETIAELAERAGFPLLAAGMELRQAPAGTGSEGGSESESEAESESESEAGADDEAEAEAGTASDDETETEDESESDDETEDEPEAETETETETEAVDEPEGRSFADVLRAGVLVKAGGRTIGIVGVSHMANATGELPASIARRQDPLEAAAAEAARLREQGADMLVALVQGDRRLARDTAKRIEGVDFVVMGGMAEADPIPPAEAHGALLLNGSRQGQGIVAVNLWPRGDADGGWNEVGGWRRELERARLEKRAEELEARIAQWEKDDSVAQSDVAKQRDRLEDMRDKLERLASPTEMPEQRNAAAAHWLELPPEAPSDSKIAGRMDALDRKINEHNARVFADAKPPPVPEGEPSYVGSAECQECHEAAYAWWDDHPHGIAYSTLVERDKQYHLECVACHVTGYNEPGGSTVTHVEGLKGVGCESCHGPSSEHVEEPEEPGLVRLEVPERVCVECHNEEHSDLFIYDSYLNTLLVPGHGRPLEGEQE